jgi:DNA mismatch repair protein MutS
MHPVDQHTLLELQIIAENNRSVSILNFFDQTKTPGGRDYLKAMLSKPKSTLSELLSLQKLLKTIQMKPDIWQISIPRAYIMAVESYYELSVAHSMSNDVFRHWFDTFIYFLRSPAEYYRIQSGLFATFRFLKAIQNTLVALQDEDIPEEITNEVTSMRKFILFGTIKSFLNQNEDRLSNRAVFRMDYYFRISHKKELRQLLDIFYRFDAYSAIIKTATQYSLTFPRFDKNINEFNAAAIWHPLIPNAVPNSFVLSNERAVCILTGANTSGKTTFLKACGIAIYLAHLGCPVPAREMSLPFFNRLYTSIHLSDDLAAGYSHFYNEMMRIKSIAESLHAGDKCFIIIDELFRGTNHDDALHCSKTVVDGFSRSNDSLFLVSTHLMELVNHYQASAQIAFHCFRTRISGSQFENSFQIEPGVSSEKVGRLIMDQTGITALLENAKRLPND